jgi:hypothetical protein
MPATPAIDAAGPIEGGKYRPLQTRPDLQNPRPTSFNPPSRKNFWKSGNGVSPTGPRNVMAMEKGVTDNLHHVHWVPSVPASTVPFERDPFLKFDANTQPPKTTISSIRTGKDAG